MNEKRRESKQQLDKFRIENFHLGPQKIIKIQIRS